MKADETISLLQSEGVEPDPVLPPLIKILAEGQVTENLDAFTAEMLSDREVKFKPHGEKITEFEVQPKAGGGKLINQCKQKFAEMAKLHKSNNLAQ